MADLRQDPVVNVIYNGIKRDIRVALDNECMRAAVILIYAGIDGMAFLSTPESRVEVISEDFIGWVDRFIHFPCEEQLTGVELYGARCAMLHSYGSESRKSRDGTCRQIGYMDQSVPEVRYAPDVTGRLLLVSVSALAEAFFTGVDKFLIYLYSDPNRAKLADERLDKMVHEFAATDGS